MDQTDYIRAAVSCLPFIGPVVGTCNILKVQPNCVESRPGSLLNWVDTVNIIRLAIKQNVSHENCGAFIKTEKQKNHAQMISNFEKGCIYAKCTITGDALTVATAVILVACKKFRISPAIFVSVACVSSGVWSKNTLSFYKRMITTLRSR